MTRAVSRHLHRGVLLLAATLLAAACSSGPTGTTPPPAATDRPAGSVAPPPGGAGSAVGPGLSVEEAMTTDARGPLLVNGFLLIADGTVRLCSGLAESLPPQCMEPSLEVLGLDPDDYPLREAQGVRWTDQPVQVLGEVEGAILRVTPNARA